MEKTKIKTVTYKHDDYYIDIVEMDDSFESYIYGKDSSLKMLMFGSAKKQSDCIYFDHVTFDDFMEMVESNLNEYIATYNHLMVSFE